MPSVNEISINVSTSTKVLPVVIRREAATIINTIPSSSLNQNNVEIGQQQETHLPNGETRENIRITINYPSTSLGTMNPCKEISIRLTNDSNPMFYFHHKITENDFPNLKTQQGLLVDFFNFPNQLLSLLEKCDPNERSMGDVSGPKFMLVMKMIGGNTILDIVESNPFKYLCHLSLNIQLGTDNEVKKYLGDLTSNLKKDLQLVQEKYTHLASTFDTESNRLKSQIEQKNIELISLKEEIHNHTSALTNRHFQDLTSEKEKILKLQGELSNKYELERNELEKRNKQVVLSLEEKILGLEAENRELLNIRYKNDASFKESTSRNKNYEEDLKILQQELTFSRKQNAKLDQDYHEKQRVVNTLQNKLILLEADSKEKHEMIKQTQEAYNNLLEQKKFFEEKCSSSSREAEKLRNANSDLNSELMKANEIIKKLQDEIRDTHSKGKLQNQITAEQERLIEEKSKKMKEIEAKYIVLKSTLAKTQTELQRTSTELKEANEKLDEQDKTIKSNENMITWLNKQLNEYQGLRNLDKFRQNLSMPNPNEFSSGGGGGDFSSRSLNKSNINNNINNNSTIPGNTPSWMHIYQSTSTPQNEDLELNSRLETHQISSNIINKSTRLGLDTISEKSGESSRLDSAGNKQQQVKGNQQNKNRPATWTRGRGKVTLDMINKPTFPLWKN